MSLSSGEKRTITNFLGSNVFRKQDNYTTLFKKMTAAKDRESVKADPFWAGVKNGLGVAAGRRRRDRPGSRKAAERKATS